MKKFKLPLIIISSFLLGGIISFLILQKQIQMSHNRDLLFAYTLKLLSIDESAITYDSNVIKALGFCLEDMKKCDLQKMSKMGSDYKQERTTLIFQQNELSKQIEALSK